MEFRIGASLVFFNARVSTQYVFDDDKTYDNKIRYLELCASYT